jgi:hypothetical protein
MTIRLTAFTVLVLSISAAAQTSRSVVTRALEPAAEDLARLNLVPAWRIYLPVENQGDSIVSVQPLDDQVFVQLRSGRVIVIQAFADPKTYRKQGDVLWVYRPAQAPGTIRPLAVSAKEVYLVHGQRFLILDRLDGKVKFSEEMTSTVAGMPGVDATNVYIPLDNRKIVTYSHTVVIPGYRPPKPTEAPDPIRKLTLVPESADALSTPQNRSPSIGILETVRPPFHRGTDAIDSSPSVGMLKNIRPPYREADATRSPSVGPLPNLRNVHELTNKDSPTRIAHVWELFSPGYLRDQPIISDDPQDPEGERLISSTGRIVFTCLRDTERINTISTEFHTEADVTAPLTNHGDYLYVATADSDLQSISIRELREPSMAANTLPRGKFTTGGPVFEKPLLTEDSLYVVGARWGLIRLKKGTLDPLWLETLPDGRTRARPNADVTRVLGVNGSYVYAEDNRGRLVVIDAIRGSTLSTFDISAFSFPVTNESNDRIYLASNSGLLICLHDRLRVKPEILRKPTAAPKKVEEPVPDPKPPEVKPPDAKPPVAKPPEEKKDPAPKKDPKAPEEKK